MTSLKSILYIEDSDIKAAGVMAVVTEMVPADCITRAKSYSTGLCLLEDNIYDLVLLDMTLPIYDVNDHDSGYEHLCLAGKVILGEMGLLKINTTVIVVTQYDSFVDMDNKCSLSYRELDELLADEFPTLYLGSVFYDAESTLWSENLKKLLTRTANESPIN
jgi:hypothetical protein